MPSALGVRQFVIKQARKLKQHVDVSKRPKLACWMTIRELPGHAMFIMLLEDCSQVVTTAEKTLVLFT